MKNILILLFILLSFNIFSIDSTEDRYLAHKMSPAIIDPDFIPDETLKTIPLLFDWGGTIGLKSRIGVKYYGGDYYFKTLSFGVEPVPNDKWFISVEATLWERITFSENNYLHLGIIGILDFECGKVLPLLNFNELYFNIKYPLGNVVIGRTNYNMKASTIFSGALDGLEVNINAPFLNFKSFAGFSGFLGILNPYFNPYTITEYDRSFVERTNLITPSIVMELNETQSRRVFFSTDFDINLYGQHLNPYFLMQYDLSQFFGNDKYSVTTFHVGSNFEGRIIENLYYQINLAGMFGTNQKLSGDNKATTIIACALQTQLRYTITKAANSTFILSYSLGTGTDDSGNFWADNTGTDKDSIYKFYYYGKFDGGFVLNPILSNIHSVSLKYMVSPQLNIPNFKFSLYTSIYQTFKIWGNASISDPEADQNNNIVGSEADIGALFNFSRNATFGIDFGVFYPEYAYIESLRLPQFRAGANLIFNF